MNEGSSAGACEEYVKATQDYSYQRDDRTLHMYKGEIFMLLRRSTPDWWQVIRQCETHAFYAPAQFLQVTVVPHEQMKQYIQQARQHQKQQQQPQKQQSQQLKKDKGHLYVQKSGGEESVVGRRPQVLPFQLSNSVGELASPGHKVPSQVYLTKIEPTLVHTERKEPYPGRHHGFSSFKSDASKMLPSHCSSNELPVSSSNLQSVSGGQESSSSHTSKSSLNDGSVESLKQLQFRKQVMKASSHDELTTGGRSQSSLDVSQPKAASSEELDTRYATRDFLFKSNQLSHRHRSNSVDFRMFQKELSFSEMKQGSLDKGRKPRISKDPGNRRRSWAVEEIRGCENFRPSLRRGEAVDAAIVLDVPPKLPPKQKKHRLDAFKSSSENLSRLEGPIDLKLQEVKMCKNMQPQNTSSLPLTKDGERGHSRHASDPLMLGQEDTKTLGREGSSQGSSRDHPVALPRKMLPPQVSPLDIRKADQETQAGERIDTLTFGEVSRDANSNQVKKSSSHSSLNTGTSAGMEGGFLRRGSSMSQSSHKHNPYLEILDKATGTPDIIRNPEGNHDSLRKHDGTPDSPRKATTATPPSQRHKQSTPEPIKKGQSSTGKSSGGFKEKFSSFKQKGGRKETEQKEEEKENDACKIPPRETPTPDSSRGGKMMPTPPSPQTPPQRIVLEDWGEYVDEGTGRPYYYNSRTREKRWKPPRKGIHSVSIPEVPTSAKGDEGSGSMIRGPPRSPAPDYPTSPTLGSQQPFSYAHLPEGPHPLTYSHSATVIPTCSPTPHPAASSHSLPGAGSFHGKGMNPPRHPLIPPVVPPSSAKPTLPVTPTTPEMPEAMPSESSALLDVLYNVPVPAGWEKRYDAFLQQVYFYNKHTHERWLATVNDEGKVYYYEESGCKSQWRLPQTVLEEIDDPDSKCDSLNRPTSPPENIRFSRLAESLPELKEYTEKEGFMQRTFVMKEGKKVRKNWTSSYVRYINTVLDTGATGILYFSKSRDDEKKPDFFEIYPRCQLEYASDRKTSRPLVLGLRNARETEVLLQFDDKEIVLEWQKFLEKQEGVDFTPTEKEEKKGKRGSDKLKRAASVEQLNPDSKGITDKLRYFIKRRPLKETLEKKGIYKESVFGSTLAELHQQDKTAIPIFVLQCINHIEKSDENLKTDGLYRISGNAAQIQKIRFEVAQRNYSILSHEKEIHNLSGSLKLFFRELKEPLIPYDFYQDFIQATGSEFRRKNQQVEKLSKAVNKLPSENYDTLKVLLQHLLRVNEFEADNRMSLSNLAIVFGPCLLWPRETNSHDLMTDVMLHNRVIEGLLCDYAKIFTGKR